MAIEDRIREMVEGDEVVLFMKGTRLAPRCGFSARVVDILDELLEDYRTVDVLVDPDLREGIKAFSSWPTIPQLYVRGRFVGGSDIVHEMTRSGELAGLLDAEAPEAPAPEVEVSLAAAQAFRRFAADDDQEPTVRLTIGPDFEPLLDLDEAREGDVVLDLEHIKLVMNRASARRADGASIDFVERGATVGFKVDNPNKPPGVKPLSVRELASMIEAGRPLTLVDVRTEEELRTASIEAAIPLASLDLEELDRATPLAFLCHHGVRSQQAAEHARRMGFVDVSNIEGGIDAYSLEVDASVPRY